MAQTVPLSQLNYVPPRVYLQYKVPDGPQLDQLRVAVSEVHKEMEHRFAQGLHITLVGK
jgi:hypothetical protein